MRRRSTKGTWRAAPQPAAGVARAPLGRAGAAVDVASLQAAVGNQRLLRYQEWAGAAPEAPASVAATLRAPGDPLPSPVRAAMETSFGADLSAVRVHSDAAAAGSAREVGARAYTVGRHVVFARGLYRPFDGAGRRLLAHELGHVLQQGGAADPAGPIAIGAAGTAAERQADAASTRAAAGLPARVSPVTGNQALLQREIDLLGVTMGKGAYPGSPTVDGKPVAYDDVSIELSDAPAAATAAERVFAWLQAHAMEIGRMEMLFGVDRRAIAGAIAWEALLNPRNAFEGAFGRFVGAGKPHVKSDLKLPAGVSRGENVPEEVEQAGLLPRRSVSERMDILAKDSIPYVAAGMRLAVDIAAAYGVFIASDPAMLTWFWQSMDANKFIGRLSQKKDNRFDPTAEKMPRWVMENLSWLSLAVGDSQLRPIVDAAGQKTGDTERVKLGTMETTSWTATYKMDARLPETRQFLVNNGQVALRITSDSEYFRASGYPMFVVLHRRQEGSDVEVGDAKKFTIGSEATFTWTNLIDGLYFLEVFSQNGVPVEGEMEVTLVPRAPLPAPAGAVLQRAPEETATRDAGVADAGTADAGVVATVPNEAALRAAAARELVTRLQAKKAIYGHELDPTKTQRKEGWWWNETEFDCSKFVLWVLAGRKVGDPPLAAGESADKAIRQVQAAPFGKITEASAVSAMIAIVDALVAEGKATAIDMTRRPRVGDLMFWGGHVAIVVDVQANEADPWLVYANMGVKGAGLVGVDAKGYHWLRASKVAVTGTLAAGDFKGYWTP